MSDTSNKKTNSNPDTYSKRNPRVPEKKPHTVDQDFVRQHPGYKAGVWMRNPSSLENMAKEAESSHNQALSKETQINEDIERYINDYNRENRESTRYLKDKIETDIQRRERLLDELRRKDEGVQTNISSVPDIEEEKRKLERVYAQIKQDELEKQRQMQREHDRMNEMIKRRINEQDKLLELERKQTEEKNKRMLHEEKIKNEMEQKKLRDLKKRREELLKEELNELVEIEKLEKKKKLIEEELKRSIKERESEKQRLMDLNHKIEELRQKEIAELAAIQHKNQDVARRRKELMDDDFVNRVTADDSFEIWLCDGKSKMCIVDHNDLCVDPISGKLVIRGDFTPSNARTSKNSPQQNVGNGVPDETRENPHLRKSSFTKLGGKVLTKRKYLELLSTYDPKKLRRKLSYQNWLINDNNLNEAQIAERFPGSDFSLEIDMAEWPAIKQESMKQYATLKGKP